MHKLTNSEYRRAARVPIGAWIRTKANEFSFTTIYGVCATGFFTCEDVKEDEYVPFEQADHYVVSIDNGLTWQPLLVNEVIGDDVPEKTNMPNFSLTAGLAMQQNQLSEWATILTDQAFQELCKKATNENAKLDSTKHDGNDVWRGTDIGRWVDVELTLMFDKETI